MNVSAEIPYVPFWCLLSSFLKISLLFDSQYLFFSWKVFLVIFFSVGNIGWITCLKEKAARILHRNCNIKGISYLDKELSFFTLIQKLKISLMIMIMLTQLLDAFVQL
jgi:hypothetical protein